MSRGCSRKKTSFAQQCNRCWPPDCTRPWDIRAHRSVIKWRSISRFLFLLASYCSSFQPPSSRMIALSRRTAQYKAFKILLGPWIELRLIDILCLEARPSFALYYYKTRLRLSEENCWRNKLGHEQAEVLAASSVCMQSVAVQGVPPGPTNARYVLLDRYNKRGSLTTPSALSPYQLTPIHIPTPGNAFIEAACYACTSPSHCFSCQLGMYQLLFIPADQRFDASIIGQLIRRHRKHFVPNNLLTGTPKASILDSSVLFLGYERYLLQCEDLSNRTRTCSFMSITANSSPSSLGEVCRPFGELAPVDPPYAHPLRAATLSPHSAHTVVPRSPITVKAVLSKDGEPKPRH